MSLSLQEISNIANMLPMPVGRKYAVKITPIHETNSADSNGFDVTTSYTDYDVYREFERPLVDEGWDVIVFVPSKEEDSDRITCGNALIASDK